MARTSRVWLLISLSLFKQSIVLKEGKDWPLVAQPVLEMPQAPGLAFVSSA